MIFKVLTAVVFIAELIIAYTLFTRLLALDKVILSYDKTVTELNPKMKDVGNLIKKISEQCIEFSENIASEIKKKRDDSITGHLNKLLIALILLRFNSKFLRKILRSRQFKFISKGLSLLKYMV